MRLVRRMRSRLSCSLMRDHSLSSTMTGSATESFRNSAIAQHIGIETVVLGSCDRKAVTETVELLGVDGIDVEAALKQRLHDRPVRRLDGDMDFTRLASARFQQPGDHLGETSAAMRDLALSDFPAAVIKERNDMLLRCPVNTNKPSLFFVHPAVPLPFVRRHGRRPLIENANARASPQPQTVPVLALFRRRLPTGHRSRPGSPGHVSFSGAHQQDCGAELSGCSQRIGSVREGYAVWAVARRARFVSLRFTSRALRRALLRTASETVQELNLLLAKLKLVLPEQPPPKITVTEPVPATPV